MVSKRGNKASGQKKQDNEGLDFLTCSEKPQNLRKLQRSGSVQAVVCAAAATPWGWQVVLGAARAGAHSVVAAHAGVTTVLRGHQGAELLCRGPAMPALGDPTKGRRGEPTAALPSCVSASAKATLCASSTALVPAGLCIHQEAAVVFLPGIDTVSSSTEEET